MIPPEVLFGMLMSSDNSRPSSPKPKSEPDDSDDSNPPPEPPAPIIISKPFVDRILWPSKGTSEPQVGSIEQSPQITFKDDLTTRVHASVEYAFHCAENVSKTAFAGSITMYCPDPLGNPVIDSMLKLVSNQVNADVLELDALELGSGALGLESIPIEVENNVEEVPRSLYTSIPPGTDERKKLEAFFTALINVPSANGTTRRIIYLRDIGSIAISAKPLASVLLRAIQDNRKEDGTFTFLLVFGVSEKMRTIENGNENKATPSTRKRRNSSPHMPSFMTRIFGSGPPRKRKVKRVANLNPFQPPFDAKTCGPETMAVDNLAALAFATSNSSTAGGGLKSLQFSAHVVTNQEDSDSDSDSDSESKDRGNDDIWYAKARNSRGMDKKHSGPHSAPEINWIDSLYGGLEAAIEDTPVFTIEASSNAEDPERQSPEQHSLEARVEAINRTAMRITVRKHGACLSKEAEDAYIALVRAGVEAVDDVPSPAAVLPLSTVHLIASIAIGLSSKENVSSEAPIVAPQHIAQAHHLSQMTVAERPEPSTASTDTADSAPATPVKKSVADKIAELKNRHDLSDKEDMFVSRILQPDLLQKTSFSDVVIDPQVKESLRSIISLPLLHPEQFSTGVLSSESLSGILLYGPPGTGKTLLCRSLAVDFDVPMIIVQPSDVFEMYLGESEKMAKAVFNVAHRIAPCIIFIDEVDAIFTARSNEKSCVRSDVQRSILTEFMTAMDGIQTKGTDGIVVIGATNRPFDLDAAILRRLPRRMLIDLPAAAQRKEILQLYLRSETCVPNLDLDNIANLTDSFSGSDLKNLCVSAALEAAKDAISDSPSDDSADDEPAAVRLIMQDHFTRALTLIQASFSEKEESNTQLHKWHEEYNGGGGTPNHRAMPTGPHRPVIPGTYGAMNPNAPRPVIPGTYGALNPNAPRPVIPGTYGALNQGAHRPMNVGTYGSTNAGASGSGAMSPPGTFGAMNAGASGAMNTGTSGAMNAGTSGAMNTGTFGSMNHGTFGAMNPSTFGAMNPSTFGAMNPGTFGAVNAGTSGVLNTGTSGAMSTATSEAMNTGTSGATNTGTGALNTGTRVMNAGTYGAMNAAAGTYGAMKAGNFGAMNGGNFGAMNPGNFGAMNGGNFGAMDPGTFGAMNQGTFGAMNAGILGDLDADLDGIMDTGRHRFTGMPAGNVTRPDE